MATLHEVETFTVRPMTPLSALRSWIFKKSQLEWKHLPAPDMVIGAGSSTHLTILAIARIFSVPSVVFMSPPIYLRSFFSLCVAPEHDRITGPNVILTKGAIHSIRCEDKNDKGHGLFLIGGPSRHHSWDSDSLYSMIHQIVAKSPDVLWTLTDSRRTPQNMRDKITGCTLSNLKFVPSTETGTDWVRDHLVSSGIAWVTEDSVSMVYEALSSGARIGILPVPRKPTASRVVRGVEELRKEGFVYFYEEGNSPPVWDDLPPARPLDESKRVAELVEKKFWHS